MNILTAGGKSRKAVVASMTAIAAVLSVGMAAADEGAASAPPVLAPETVQTGPAVAGTPVPETAASTEAAASARTWLGAGIIGTVIAGLVAILGLQRIGEMMGSTGKAIQDGAVRTANFAGKAARGAIGAGGRLLRKPLRFLLILVGGGIFLLTGISVMDIEWQAGLVAGLGLAGSLWYGARKLGRVWPGRRAGPVQDQA